jgi:hypothetical protein
MDTLREYFNKTIIINNWAVGGPFQDRGLRDSTSNVYDLYSDHSYGRAIDFNVEGMTDADVQKAILNEYADDLIILGLTGIEDSTPTWTHIGVSDLSTWDFKLINGIYIIPSPFTKSAQ